MVIFVLMNIKESIFDLKETGRLIRERRRVLGIDQKTTAELSGISIHTLSDIESGKGNPSVKVLCKILDALGLEMRIELKRMS
jgi:transcriptional regulator with XRE-family HTH domain